MIENFYPEEEYGACRSTGCSCCSCEYDIKNDKKKILQEARDNIRVVKKICEFYKLDFSKFCKDILTEKKCRKHKFFKPYTHTDQEVCYKCGFWKKSEESVSK